MAMNTSDSLDGTISYLVLTTGVSSWVRPRATILCLNAKVEMASIASRTIDDCLRILPVAASNNNPPLWDHAVEGSVDMVTYAPNVSVTCPNLVGVHANFSKPELLVPRVISTAE